MDIVPINKIIQGDALEELKKLPSEFINCIITSPPYFGLRDYQVKGQLGLEKTLNEYIEKLLKITLELKRILRKDGVMFWNMGSAYANVHTQKRERYKISDDYIRLLGWVWTDGTIDKERKTVRIYQTKEQGKKEIERILKNLSLTYSNYKGKSEKERQYYISAKERICEKLGLYSKKELPFWTKLLSREQLLIFLDALLQGDGTVQKYSKELAGSKEKLEPLHQLFNENNLSCTLNQNSRGDWYIHFSQEIFNPHYLRAKCLDGQNFRLILRMIDEQGWILRNTIIWNKPNAMPSSVKDRFANKYENVYMLVKNKKYWFDLDAVRVPQKYPEDVARRIKQDKEAGVKPFQKGDPISLHLPKYAKGSEFVEKYGEPWDRFHKWDKNKKQTSIPQDQAESFGSPRVRYWRDIKNRGNAQKILKERGCRPTGIGPTGFDHNLLNNPLGKNRGDVWTIPTQPCPKDFRGVHFAIFPEKLVEPMILSSCPPNGICLDPFMGLGTVGVVAKRLKRNFIGIDIKKEYCEIAEARIKAQPQSLF